jgi:putative transposase
MDEKKFDFEAFVRQTGEQLRSGKHFTGADGVFTPLLKHIPEASLKETFTHTLKIPVRLPGTGATAT